MLATYNETLGLTGVKAAYPNCLLINNCAVYQGCVDAAWLYSVLPDCGEKAAEMEAYASRLCEGIETYFWDETSGRYRTAVSQDGEPVDADESTEAFAQLYPLLCGLPEADGAREQALYAAFRDEAMSGWLAQTTGAEIRAVLGQAVLKAGDAENALAFLVSLHNRYAETGYSYPFSSSDAGYTLLTVDGLLALCPPADTTSAPLLSEAGTASEGETVSEASSEGSVLPAALAAVGFAALVAVSVLLYFRRKKK